MNNRRRPGRNRDGKHEPAAGQLIPLRSYNVSRPGYSGPEPEINLIFSLPHFSTPYQGSISPGAPAIIRLNSHTPPPLFPNPAGYHVPDLRTRPYPTGRYAGSADVPR